MRRVARPLALVVSLVVSAALAAACASEGSTPTSTPASGPRTSAPSTGTPARFPSPPITPGTTAAATPATTTPTGASTSRPTATPTAVPAPRSVALGQRVTLGVGGEVAIAGTTWLVRFEGVLQDSRCPLDVRCIQAGSVTAVFTAADGRVSQRLPATLEGSSPARVVLGEFELTLHAVEPQPLASRPTSPDDYRATIAVDRPAPPRASGIDGLVTLGPLCPVMREDEPCPDRPFEATLVIRSAAGFEVARLRSDPAGRFAIDLPPGRYVIEPQRIGTSPLPVASPVDVTIIEAQRVAVLIEYDSGIR